MSSYAQSSEALFKNIVRDLEQIGSKPQTEVETNLMMMRYSSITQYRIGAGGPLKLDDGMFLVMGMKKDSDKRSDFDKARYYRNDLNKFGEHYFDGDTFGSGFLYDKYIVTNYHVCRGQNSLVKDSLNKVYAVKALAWNDKQDICIFQAPKQVLGQRNFATFKSPVDALEEEKRSLRIQNQIDKLSLKDHLNSFDEEKMVKLKSELIDQKRNYATVYSIWGEFNIYKIEKDLVEDKWSLKNSFQGYGKKCQGGISGGPVSSPSGFVGYSWAAEEGESRRINKVREELKRIPSAEKHEKEKELNPICYYVDKVEVEDLIKKYESK